MKKILLSLTYILLVYGAEAQTTINIKSGTQVTGSGTVQVVAAAGTFSNTGTYSDLTGSLLVKGGLTFDGSGTTTVKNLTIDHATGTTTFSSLVSVRNTATITSGTVNVGSGNLYIRTDIDPTASVVNNGVLTGTIQGLVTNASAVTGGCPSYSSTLSHNISGSPMRYQWQTSPDNGTWTNVPGATNATYVATVTATIYYRCNLSTSNSAYSQGTPGKQLVMTGTAPGAITGTFTVCQAATTALSNSASGGVWSSSNPSIGSVDATTGVVTGVASGTVNITYSTGCGSDATHALTVNPLPNAGTISGIAFACVGSTSTLSTSGSGGAWSSSTPSVGTVSTGGIVNAISAGTTTISYSASNGCGTDIATRVFTVNPLPNPGTISGTPVVCVDATTTLSTTGTGGAWSSSNIAIGTVSASGVVRGISAGTTVISYFVTNSCGTDGATQVVTVNPLATPGTITGTASVCVGATTTLAASGTTGGAWSSSNIALGTVSASGVVTGIAEGTLMISYTVTNSCGPVSATKSVTVNPLATPGTITGTPSVCVGATTALNSTGTAGGAWTSSNTAIGTISGTGVVTGISAGNTTISYTVTNGCGSVSTTQGVTVNPLATPGTISGTASVCEGATTTLSASGTSGGTWSSSNTAIGTVNASSGVVTGITAGTTNITYTVTNGCGAVATSQTVTVNPLATPGTISGTTSVCVGATTSLSASGTGGGTWSSTNTTIATVSSTGVVTGVSSGNATISYTVTNGCGAVAATTTVTVNALPAISGISNDGPGCVSGTLNLSSTITGGVAPYSYSWSGPNSFSSTQQNPLLSSLTLLDNGVYSLTATDNNGCGATGSNTTNVIVNPLPDAGTISGLDSVYVGGSTTLSTTGTGGSWSSSNTAVATISSGGVVTGVSEGSVVLSYTLTTGCGTSVATHNMLITSATGDIIGSLSLCTGIGSTLSTTGLGGGTWTSSNTAVATIGASSGIVYPLTTGTSIISYTLSGFTTSVEITVNPTPATITGNPSGCFNTATTLSNATGGGSWISSNTAIATINSGGSYSGVSPGTATITYMLSTGCYKTLGITINPTPAAITGSLAICEGNTTTLTSATTGGTSWISSNTSIATIGLTNGLMTGIAAGTATITYTAATGCKVKTTITIEALPSAITGSAFICKNTTGTLSSTSSGGTWASSNTAIATIDASGDVFGVSPGYATITYTIATGCRTTLAITVGAVPAGITGTGSMCVGSGTNLSSATPGCTWSSDNTSIATVSSTGVVSGISGGNATISYTHPLGCAVTKEVTVNAGPSANTGSPTICLGFTTTLSNATSGGAWTSSNTAKATVNTSTGVVTGISAGTANITYTVGAGCFSTTQVTVSAGLPTITGSANVNVGGTTALSNSASGGTWSSSNTALGTVDASSGIVTGIAAGVTTITYNISGCFTTMAVTVNAPPSPITGSLVICETQATVMSSTTPGGLSWTSSDPSVATIGLTSGLVNAISAGTTTITYTVMSGAFTTAVLTVQQMPSAITGTLTVCQGATTALTSAGTGGGTWTSSATTKAIIGSSSGIVTGTGGGTSTISYIWTNGCKRSAVVTVSPLPALPAITGAGAVSISTPITITGSISGGTWSSNNTALATVASSGAATATLTGVSAGLVYITYTITNSCGSNFRARAFTVTSPRPGIDIAGNTTSTTIRLYPNPTSGMFTIDAPVAGTLSIYTLDGRMAAKYELTATSNELTLPKEFAAGIYMCRFEGNDGASTTVRLVYEQ